MNDRDILNLIENKQIKQVVKAHLEKKNSFILIASDKARQAQYTINLLIRETNKQPVNS